MKQKGKVSSVLGATLAAALLIRAHYLLYVRKRDTRLTTLVTWLATVFVVGFWTWQWTT